MEEDDIHADKLEDDELLENEVMEGLNEFESMTRGDQLTMTLITM